MITTHLTDERSAGKHTDDPVEDHECLLSAVDRFGVLADLRSRFHGEIEAADVGQSFALVQERRRPKSAHFREDVICARVQMDQVQHVRQGAADPDDQRRGYDHVQAVKEFPKRKDLQLTCSSLFNLIFY